MYIIDIKFKAVKRINYKAWNYSLEKKNANPTNNNRFMQYIKKYALFNGHFKSNPSYRTSILLLKDFCSNYSFLRPITSDKTAGKIASDVVAI